MVDIVVDALGADNAPSVVLDGVKKALILSSNLNVHLCGPYDVVNKFSKSINSELDREVCMPVECSEVIKMDDDPARSIRKKKNSSIVIGCKLAGNNECSGFYSAGNTGACMAAATLYTGRIPRIKRPALAVFLPTIVKNKYTLFCDVGANADCKPEYIVQFAEMAQIFYQSICEKKDTSIGLLNIGEESSKGSKFAQTCNKLLSDNVENFYGNAEGRDILTGKFDIVVTDGFTGNIALKNMEGTIKSTLKMIKDIIMSSKKTQLGGLLLKNSLKSQLSMLDPNKQGGAILLGCKSVVCIGHGSSNSEAICNGILKTASYVSSNVVLNMTKAFAE